MASIIDAASSVSITVTQPLPEAIFTGSVTYSPGQTVVAGTPVTIGYTVNNTGGTGILWGGLYDNAVPNPNLIAGYWEQSIAAGAGVVKTVQVTPTANLSAQLLCGHME